MKTHTTKGCDLLKNINGALSDDYKRASYEICRHHHEKYDGKGYPDGLRGEEIPISAQIVSVADVYDALVCERVYKDAFTKEQAFNMIVSGECGMFNPKLMDAFRKCVGGFEKVADDYRAKRGEI
jgi:putative two-component system response regulator